MIRSFCINPPKPVIRSSQSNPEAPVLTSDSNTGNIWFKDGKPESGENSPNLTSNVEGVYTLRVKIDDCVSEESAPISLIRTGDITTTFNSSGFSVYPNPFIHEIRILWNNPETTQEREVTLYDMMGHKIESKAGNTQEFIFDASGLSSGTYLIKGAEGNRTHFERIVKH